MDLRWWTFAGARANSVLTAAIGDVTPNLLDDWSFGNLQISFRADTTAPQIADALRRAKAEFGDDLKGVLPSVSDQALKKLKFAEMLPPNLASATLAARAADHQGAARVAARSVASG